LKGQRQGARECGSSPAGDDARLPRVVASVGSGHRDVAGVGVSGDVCEAERSDVVGKPLVEVINVACMSDEGGEGAKRAGLAGYSGAGAAPSEHRVLCDRSASAVGCGDSLGATDESRPARVLVG